jgi:hypothetical protein
MMRRGQTGHVEHGHILDLKVLADFIYVSYYGSLKQWREFLSAKEYLPDLFSTIDIASTTTTSSGTHPRGFLFPIRPISCISPRKAT